MMGESIHLGCDPRLFVLYQSVLIAIISTIISSFLSHGRRWLYKCFTSLSLMKKGNAYLDVQCWGFVEYDLYVEDLLNLICIHLLSMTRVFVWACIFRSWMELNFYGSIWVFWLNLLQEQDEVPRGSKYHNN
jgi:hypothetical protein